MRYRANINEGKAEPILNYGGYILLNDKERLDFLQWLTNKHEYTGMDD